MPNILDQSGDLTLKETARFAKLYTFPDFAKQAEFSDIIAPEQPKQHLYADIREPFQFPCHTKAATYFSYLFFTEKKSSINQKIVPLIQERLDKFAEYWGIKRAVKDIVDRHNDLNKVGEYPDSDYALVWVSDKTVERRLPMRNAAEVKAAADWFNNYNKEIRSEFSFKDRQTIANKILDKSAEYGVSLAEHIELLEKAAGRGVCNPKEAEKLITDRVKAASRCTSAMSLQMSKLASMVSSNSAIFFDPATMSELAETIDQFDRTHGLLNKYTDMLPAPEDVLFSATHTKTSELCRDACSLTTGSVYDLNEFSKLSASAVSDLFGDEVANSVCKGLNIDPEKMAEVAATFPRNDATIFEQLLQDAGISPLAKQANTRTGFSFDQLQALASQGE